ncbi:MAG: transketolase [Anaerovoracaceae bacterium]|jgi:transketolase
MDKNELAKIANQVRIDIIKSTNAAGSGHPGGSLSATDIITYLYFEEMNIDPKDPRMAGRDRFVLSKGHAAPALYSVLAERGYFPREELLTLRKLGSRLQGHPNRDKVPGVEMSTGSLGQGFSVACGMALANKMDNSKARVYTMVGDGEIQEGIIWEAAMSAAHYHLDNLVGILDWNGLQIDGKNEDVMTVTPIDKKFEGFGWNVIQCSGHDFDQIADALQQARKCSGKPTMIIARTHKGHGVSFMEDAAEWHGKSTNEEQYVQAMKELGGEI